MAIISNLHCTLLSWLLASAALSSAQAQSTNLAQSDPETKGRAIKIETVPGRLMFTPRSIHVQPGELLHLTVKNNGPVPHNLVICGEGSEHWKQVADLVIDLGAAVHARAFNPGPPLVTHATGLIRHGEEAKLDWRAPKVEGIYPFLSSVPGHAPLMRGELIVRAAPIGITDIRYRYYEGEWDDMPSPSELDALEASASGEISGNRIDLDTIPNLLDLLRKRGDDASSALVITANVHVPFKSDYTFALTSSAPSALLIGEVAIVEHNGAAGETRFGKVELGSPEPTNEVPPLRLQLVSNGAFETPGLRWHGKAGSADLSVAAQYDYLIAPETTPFAATFPMPEASALSLAIRLPDSTNFCFDPETLSVPYVWLGGFIDARSHADGEEEDGSGWPGGDVRPLGKRIPLGANASFPLRIGGLANEAPDVTYLGHTYGNTTGKKDDTPSLLFQVGERTVTQKILIGTKDPAEPIITFSFQIDPLPAAGVPVVFSADPKVVELNTTRGWANNGVAVLTADKETHNFEVSLQYKKK